MSLKQALKKIGVGVGLVHPSLGIKISADEKVRIILEHKGVYDIFVETGTSKGETLRAVKNSFTKIYSIELDPVLFERAKVQFASDTHIMLLCGNSASELAKIMRSISDPVLFWLDAHGDGEITAANSPIIGELEAVFSHPIKKHTILIDDARHFSRSTIGEIKNMAQANNYTFSIESGIFRILPR